jgi:segregation and condensation protein B
MSDVKSNGDVPTQDAGLSLDQLNQAFAEMLGGGADPYQAPPESDPSGIVASDAAAVVAPSTSLRSSEPAESPEDATCEITPRSILEAMLFVGRPDNQPLESAQIAKLMRGVRPAEVDDLVRELNEVYASQGSAYTIVSEGAGYRLRLRDELAGVRDKFYGKAREARLSPAAVEVLSLVAYRGPLSSDEVNRLRGTVSGSILSQLVRRQLLAVERGEEKPRRLLYFTTQRFLDLFGLESLDDLPRSQDLDKR